VPQSVRVLARNLNRQGERVGRIREKGTDVGTGYKSMNDKRQKESRWWPYIWQYQQGRAVQLQELIR
jgi:hypothetical protein